MALALTGIAVASAFASPEWHVKEKGVWAKVTKSTPVAIEGSFSLYDEKLKPASHATAISCRLVGEATVKPAGKGAITSFIAKSCEPVKPKSGTNLCETVKRAESIGLGWALELYTEGSEIRQKLKSEGSGSAEFSYECSGLFGTVSEKCALPANSHMHDSTLLNLVELEFDSKAAKSKCKEGGAESGEWKGVLKIKATEAGIEAIKVE